MELLLTIWCGILVLLVIGVVGRRWHGGALVLAYFLLMSLVHVPGAVLHAGERSVLSSAPLTLLGFRLAVMGFSAFFAGALVTRLMVRPRSPHPPLPYTVAAVRWASYDAAVFKMMAAGAIAYFGLLPVARFVPSTSALILPVSSVLILGFWLRLYASERFTHGHHTLGTLLALPLLPGATLLTQGFIGYGTGWAVSVLSFVFVISRQRWRFYVLAPLVAVFGLSLFVTYLGDRVGLREVIWGQADFNARLDRIGLMLSKFQHIDFDNRDHQDLVNARLNLNYFVGAAVERHNTGMKQFAYGATVAPWALIPRVVWPDKPDIGGGRDVVRDYTGLILDKDTSWGAGQTFEFYVNFGVPGVVLGFFLFGALLMRLDHGLMAAFESGNIPNMLLFGMPAFSLLQPEGNLLEIVVRTVAAVIVARAIFFLARHWSVNKRPHSVRDRNSVFSKMSPL